MGHYRKDHCRGIAHFIVLLLATSMFALAPLSAGQNVAFAKSTLYRLTDANRVGHITLTVDKSHTIKVDKKFSEVQIGNSKIADVMPLTDSSFYLLGKKIGTTNVSIYNSERKLIGVIDVEVSYDIRGLKTKLKQNLRGTNIKVSSLNGKILLSGVVPNAPAAKRAVAIAKQYAPKMAITNNMTLGSSQQVMLEVRFVETTRKAGRELGINFSGTGKGTAVTTGVGLLSGAVPFGSLITNLLGGGLSVDMLINALEEKGLARRLAEPNLTALSGDTASFLAGGEFPFPVGAKDGEVKIEFKKFGVGLSFTPTVLAGGMIHLEIEPEVSQLDPTVSLRLAGFDIPSLIVRRAHTTIELRDGQSFAIAGLLQTNHSKSKKQLPWLGNVPVLGALFSSSSYQKNETDLVIIVTPHLVRPAAPGQHLATPVGSKSPSNDVDFFLNGKMDISKQALKLYQNGDGTTKNFGHILVSTPRRVGAYRQPKKTLITKASVSYTQNFGVDAHVLE